MDRKMKLTRRSIENAKLNRNKTVQTNKIVKRNGGFRDSASRPARKYSTKIFISKQTFYWNTQVVDN